MVKVSAEYLAHMDIKQMGAVVNEIIGNFIELPEPANVTRIDLFVDFASPGDMEWNRHGWITRAEAIWAFVENDGFTGWMIGAGSPMVGRLYDKQRQAHKMGLKYIFDLWRAVGWDGESKIWRQEFQLRSQILRQFGLRTLPEVLGNLNGLWSYATTDWLRLTIPNATDKTRSRWPIHPLWAYLSAIDWETNGGPLSREFKPLRVPSDERLAMPALGTLTSIMAKQGITDIRQGIIALFDLCEQQYSSKAEFMGQPYEDYVLERVAVKGRQFNTILNEEAILEKVEAQRLARTADDYLRARDG